MIVFFLSFLPDFSFRAFLLRFILCFSFFPFRFFLAILSFQISSIMFLLQIFPSVLSFQIFPSVLSFKISLSRWIPCLSSQISSSMSLLLCLPFQILDFSSDFSPSRFLFLCFSLSMHHPLSLLPDSFFHVSPSRFFFRFLLRDVYHFSLLSDFVSLSLSLCLSFYVSLSKFSTGW